jgi:hypothetical protein
MIQACENHILYMYKKKKIIIIDQGRGGKQEGNLI